jgi:calcium/calmodulin dependent protein kinase II association protein
MFPSNEIRDFLYNHLQAIFGGDLQTYHATTVPDLTLYEWYITPHRIDGIPFHDFQMAEAARSDTTSSPLVPDREGLTEKPRTRFDLAHYAEQRYGDTAIASYTMLISQSTPRGVKVLSYNESRVMVKFPEGWKVVHVHKSPSWNAPFQPASAP